MFKVGDKVRIISRFKDGVDIQFNSDMDELIDTEGVITGRGRSPGQFEVDSEGISWVWPEDCLELVKEKPKQKHPQAEFIKAWLDGQEVEFKSTDEYGRVSYELVEYLYDFVSFKVFRIKPKTQEILLVADVEADDYYGGKYMLSTYETESVKDANVKFIVENGKIVDVQLIKQSD